MIAQHHAQAAADGRVGAAEQGSIQRSANRQSKRIFNKKHDGVAKD